MGAATNIYVICCISTISYDRKMEEEKYIDIFQVVVFLLTKLMIWQSCMYLIKNVS